MVSRQCFVPLITLQMSTFMMLYHEHRNILRMHICGNKYKNIECIYVYRYCNISRISKAYIWFERDFYFIRFHLSLLYCLFSLFFLSFNVYQSIHSFYFSFIDVFAVNKNVRYRSCLSFRTWLLFTRGSTVTLQ